MRTTTATRLGGIRKNGLIPERRHDALLLAILLAVGLNVALFAAQALLPRLAELLRMLGVTPSVVREEEFPFVLVDPSLLDEEVAPENAAATAAISREARQPEAAPEEGEDVFRPEGVDELLTMAEGNPGEIDPGADSAGLPEIENIGDESSAPAEPAEELPEEIVEPEAAVEDAPEPAPAVEIEEIEPVAAPEPVQEFVETPEAEPLPLPEQPVEVAEPAALPGPEVVPEVRDIPPEPVQQAFEPVEEVVRDAGPVVDPVPELIELAMLPPADDGIFAPPVEPVREPPVAAPVPEQFAAPTPFQPEERPERAYRPPVPAPEAPVRPDAPVRPPRRQRSDSAPRATFREVGGAGTAGGAPPRRSMRGDNVNIFDDPYMALLANRYPEYMGKLARKLQDSLNRTMFLYPSYYASGQAKLLFRIAPDGTVGWYETLYPVDGSDDTLRSISERTLLEAGPFDPPPAAMLADPVFQRMSMTVNIY